MKKHGGDRKSAKYHIDNTMKKGRSLITDFMSRSNNRHLSDSNVILATKLLDDSRSKLHSLEEEKLLAERNHGRNAIKRLELEEQRAGAFTSPISKDELSVKLQWINHEESMLNICDLMNKQHEKIVHLEKELEKESKIAKRKYSFKEKIDNEMKVVRRNHIRKTCSTVNMDKNNGTRTDEDLPNNTNNVSNIDSTLVMTQVGYIEISSISDNGLAVSGFLNATPYVKFYSGILFENLARKKAPVIREKANAIKCIPGFTDINSNRLYQLNNISSNEIVAVSIDDPNDVQIRSYDMNSHKFILKWILHENSSTIPMSNITHAFGEAVMPSNRSKIRKLGLGIVRKYIPVPEENRKRKKPNVKKNRNEVYSRYKKTRITVDELIKRARDKEPMYASCLESCEDSTAIYDSCCNKNLSLVFQNLMKHINSKKHKSNCDSKKEAKEVTEKILDKMKTNRKNNDNFQQVTSVTDASTAIRIEMRRVQMKSYSPRSTVEVFSNVLNRHSIDGNIANISHIGDYTSLIQSHEIETLEKLFSKMGDKISIIQDSTNLFDEQFAISARGMDEDGLWVQQRFIGMWSTNHHLTGINMGFVIEKALQRLNKDIRDVIAMSADRASSNNTAWLELIKLGDKIMLIGCFSHTLDKVGKKFDAPELKEFMNHVRSMLSISHEAKRLFRTFDSEEKDLAGYAAIRWWNDWVQQLQIFNMGIDKIETLAQQLKQNDKCEASSSKILILMGEKKAYARLLMQIAASLDYAAPFCKTTFNLEGDADGLAFVTGTEIEKIVVRISSLHLNIDRVKKHAVKANTIVQPLADKIKIKIDNAKDAQDDYSINLANCMEVVERARARKAEEGDVLEFGDKVVMKRRVGRHHVKGVVTSIHFNELDGTVSYDVTPIQGACHNNVSEFDLVKAVSETFSRARQQDENKVNLNACDLKKDIQQARLSDLPRLESDYNTAKKVSRDAQSNFQKLEEDLTNFGPITEEDWVQYAKEVVKPGLDYARARFVDVDTVNRGRGSFGINKGLKATKAFTAATIFNPEVLVKKDIDEVKSYLSALINFDFVTKDMINDAIMESDTVLNHARRHATLPDIDLKDHSTMQKGNTLKKKVALRNILARRRREVVVVDTELNVDGEGYTQLPDGILPDEPGIEDLQNEAHHTTKKAYAIMEWWRCSGNDIVDTSVPRFKAFPAWGALLKLISLCVPSSAAVERVFSQLKLCLSAQRTSLLQDDIETSLLLRVNDVPV